MLSFDDHTLRRSLTFCYAGAAAYGQMFDQREEAEEVVYELWPGCPGPLEEERSLQEELAGTNCSLFEHRIEEE